MQTTAIRTVANSLPENEVILLTLLISKRYIPYTELHKNAGIINQNRNNSASCTDNKRIVNWKAQLQNINSRETGKSIALSFELEYIPEQYRKVTLMWIIFYHRIA